MARPPNPAIRVELLERAIDHTLIHGLADFTLRPLAKALKTNARMLVYHFGSREGLMQEILMGLRKREDERIQSWLQGGKNRSLADFLEWYWERLSSPQARPALLLIFELYALALRNPKEYPGVLTDPLAYWRRLSEQTTKKSEADTAQATLLLGATRGLLLDLCATGDRARIGKAVRLLRVWMKN